MIRFLKRWLPARDEVRKPMRFARQSVAMIRREYQGKPLEEHHVSKNPIDQFEIWFEEAVSVIEDDPNAMILSTVNEEGMPSSRTVLMKMFDDQGFVFYTNYESQKAREIASNPNVSLVFYWPDMVRQICIQGVAEKTTDAQSDAYFRTRPVSSQLSAVASPQSRRVSSRSELEKRVKQIRKEYEDEPVKRPSFWGGYLVRPHRVEFWQGRINRLHDRICYTRRGGHLWNITRLAP